MLLAKVCMHTQLYHLQCGTSYVVVYTAVCWHIMANVRGACSTLCKAGTDFPPVAVRVSDLSLHLYLYPYTDISRHTYVPR